jgi:hypothetical protein
MDDLMGAIARRVSCFLLLIPVTLCAAQSSRPAARMFENQYLRISVLPGWTFDRAAKPGVSLTHGKYILTINPFFGHVSGVICGRFYERTGRMRSVQAVMTDVPQPDSGRECLGSSGPGHLVVNKTITLDNLYTGGTNPDRECTFPKDGHSVWFGSEFCDQNGYSEYTITLGYDSDNVNGFPRRGASDLQQVFNETAAMLRTLEFKPPVTITKIVPSSAYPGETVTLYGDGFGAPVDSVGVEFEHYPNLNAPFPEVSEDGRSLTFKVRTSMGTDNCPGTNHYFGFMPTPPGDYQIRVSLGMVDSNPVTLGVQEQKTPVSISCMYPGAFGPGEIITLLGSGFTAADNTVHIGDASIEKLASPDGTTLKFPVPFPREGSLPPVHEASVFVSNANGKSNEIMLPNSYL